MITAEGHNASQDMVQANTQEQKPENSDLFDWDRFEKDNEESNLQWTGRRG